MIDLSSLGPLVTPVIGFTIAALVGLGISYATFRFAKASGLTSVQGTLIDTLQDNARALSDRVKILEDQVAELTAIKVAHEKEIADLQDAVTDLAKENTELRKQAGRSAVRRSSP